MVSIKVIIHLKTSCKEEKHDRPRVFDLSALNIRSLLSFVATLKSVWRCRNFNSTNLCRKLSDHHVIYGATMKVTENSLFEFRRVHNDSEDSFTCHHTTNGSFKPQSGRTVAGRILLTLIYYPSAAV